MSLLLLLRTLSGGSVAVTTAPATVRMGVMRKFWSKLSARIIRH